MLPITVYEPPYGKKHVVIAKNVNLDDANFFIGNKLVVSGEQMTVGFVLYSTTGKICEISGEENEIIYIVPNNQTFREAISKLRELVEKEREGD